MSAPAHAETYDITTYTPPSGWKAQTEKGAITYTTIDQAAGTFCRLQIYTSTKATANARADFDAEWKLIVLPVFKGIAKPTVLPASKSTDGWDITAGTAETKFDGKTTLVVQIVAAKAGVRVPMLYVATGDCSPQLDAFTNTVTFATAAPAVAATAPATDTWAATPKTDWVEVTSKLGKVLVHFPNAKADAYNSSLAAGLRTAWDTLVAPHYTSITNLVVKPIQSWESIAFAEADAVDPATKRAVHVVLFKKHDYNSQNRYLEFVNDSKAAYEAAWGPYHNDERGLDKLIAMGAYDRFTVSAATLAGTWTSTDFSSISYYYVSSGRAAGTDTTSSADKFVFDGKTGYSSDWAGASGPAGQAKFARVQYRGAYAVDKTGVKLALTNRFKGATETYTAYFRAVKGGNILVLIDARNSVTYLGKKP